MPCIAARGVRSSCEASATNCRILLSERTDRASEAWAAHLSGGGPYQPVVTSPIIGVTKPRHLEDALAAVDLVLTADEIDELEAPYQPHAIAGHR